MQNLVTKYWLITRHAFSHIHTLFYRKLTKQCKCTADKIFTVYFYGNPLFIKTHTVI